MYVFLHKSLKPHLAHTNNMKHTPTIYLFLAALLTACSTDIEFTEPSNRTGAIQFLVGTVNSPIPDDTETAITRADDHTHTTWDPAIHPTTLAVYGVCNGGSQIFDNQKVTYNSTTKKWEYTSPKYWPDYTAKTPLDFFGYMLETSEVAPDLPPSAALTPDGSTYTLSFPAKISSPILTSANKTPLICHTPLRITNIGNSISFEMDQTLTAYSLHFQLGEKMDNVRDFKIKSVKVYGNNLPTGGTISRTYTLSNGTWTAGDVKWTDVTTLSERFTQELTADELTVDTHTEWKQWGECTFYAIPHESFTPTIEVTYNVVANIDNNGDKTVITRKDVTSTINFTNFESLTTGKTGKIHPIQIKIVPDYLYVLSDDDQSTGFLVVNNIK